MLPSLFVTLVRAASRRLEPVRDFALEQRRLLRNDVLAVKGLMPLLMKTRNGDRWTREDRDQLRACVKRLTVASPYLVVLLMPGGLLLLPLLAWWLDRRSRGRDHRSGAARRPVP